MAGNPADNSTIPFPPDLRTTDLPAILWIELTSKCPFDCVFCSRKTLRGAGEHMDFALYESLIGQLHRPEIIRLNYSGESTHYPRLLEAIGLARATGGRTELVSALALYPDERIEALITSGLDRLTVSLHTLDDRQFSELYRFSSLSELRRKLGLFRQCQRRLRATKPILDFAFVAMQSNLGQLEPVAEYARNLGIETLFIHPVIRRTEIPARFDRELAGDRLRPEFQRDLQAALQTVRARLPEVSLCLSTQEIDPDEPV